MENMIKGGLASEDARVGMRVTYSGFEGTITEIPSWDPRLAVVYMTQARGSICVAIGHLLPAKARA